MFRLFVTAIVPFTTSGGSRRAGGGGAASTSTTTTATTVPVTATAGCATGVYTSPVCDQRWAGGRALCQRFDSGRATILWCGSSVGRVPRPGCAARPAAGAAAAPASDPPARGAAGERAGPVRDPILRPQLAGDGRAQRHAAAPRIARQRAGSAPVPAGAHAPRGYSRIQRRPAAAAWLAQLLFIMTYTIPNKPHRYCYLH